MSIMDALERAKRLRQAQVKEQGLHRAVRAPAAVGSPGARRRAQGAG